MTWSLSDTLPSNILVFHLLATGFITGILDATTYSEFGVFTSNQTGNSVLLAVGALGIARVRLVDVATSLAGFTGTALVLGQLAVRVTPGQGRTRWWILVTTWYQCVTILLVAGLSLGKVIQFNGHWSWLVILLLASSSGAQVAMARQFAVPEIPTAMLTSPFVDLLTDPYLFSLTVSESHNTARNRRASYIVSLIAGCFIGATIHKYAGSKVVVLVAGSLKVLVFATFFVTPAEKKSVGTS